MQCESLSCILNSAEETSTTLVLLQPVIKEGETQANLANLAQDVPANLAQQPQLHSEHSRGNIDHFIPSTPSH